MDMSYPLQLDMIPRDPGRRKKMEKRQLGNRLWFPVLCLTSWFTLEAGACGPRRWISSHFEFSIITSSWLMEHLLSPLILCFSPYCFSFLYPRGINHLPTTELRSGPKNKILLQGIIELQVHPHSTTDVQNMPALMALSISTIILSP